MEMSKEKCEMRAALHRISHFPFLISRLGGGREARP